MLIKTALTTLTCAGLGFGLSFATVSRAEDDRAEMNSIARQANLIGPERAVEIAQAQQAGTVTDVDLDNKRGNWIYEIEITDAQGKEWEVEVEGAAGNIVKVQRDWF